MASYITTTLENAELQGMQSSPKGECYELYQVGTESFTASIDMAIIALRNAASVTVWFKHHSRGWEKQ